MKQGRMRLAAAFLFLTALAAAQIVPGRYIVELDAEPLGNMARVKSRDSAATGRTARIAAEQRRAGSLVRERGGAVLDTLQAVMNALVVDIPENQSGGLSSLPGVKKIYPVTIVHLRLDHALPLHQAPEAWSRIGGMEKAGAGVKIAMLDTGITPEHPGFQDPSLKVPGGYPLVSKPENLALTNNKIIVARNYEQFYMEDEPDTARDRYGHGTATAMCAAGVPNQGPYGRIAGVAPKAWIGAYKITSLNGDTANTAVMMKAFDDALADGMDVISVSFGSDLVLPLEQDPISVAVERATGFGMVVVVSAGNSGPALGTIGDTASIPSAISVGASDTDRIFGGSVAIGSAPPIRAFAGSVPSEAISAAVRDAGAFDSSRLACDPLPAGSLNQSIALISRGTCTFEQKLNNAEAAGAKAAIIYSTALQAPAQFTSGKARLPGVLIGFADGNAIQAALQSGADVIARIAFDGIPFPNDPIRLTGFSSRGPTYFYGIKPDLSATGYVYTATQSADEEGGMYNRVGYIETQGTSFSAPLVAGAAAVLKGARPGLSAAQYRSLLINTASPMSLHAGYVERVQQTGAGILNLAGAIGGTVAAYPISLSFGIGPGTIDAFDQLALTNAGKVADTFTISSIPYDDAPPLRFSEDPPGGGATTAVITERIAPGQTRTIYPYWRFKSFGPGEYQGQIIIQGTQPGSMALVPYWYGIPSSVPDAITVVLPPPAQLTVNQTFGIYFRVTDSSGIAVLDRTSLKFNGTVVAGGGTITGLNLNSPFPNLVFASIHMGPELGTNTFRVSFGNLAPITFEIEGVRAKEP